MKRIYLDYAATTPLDKRVSKVMRDFELEFFGNPSSTHLEGQQARAQIDYARDAVAKFFAVQPQEIIFTSGATEANNMAILGVVNFSLKDNFKPHVITTSLEHQSVYNTVKRLAERGVVDADFIKPRNGNILADDVIAAIKPNTVLVSAIFASNEIGSILPVREIGSRIKDLGSKIIYHIDAVQATKFFNCNVEKLGCDLLTASAHKIYGPKGIGVLFANTGVKMENLAYGGSQEYGKRPGTQNTAGIIGCAKAFELLGPLEVRQAEGERLSKLRDFLISNLEKFPDAQLNGPVGDSRCPDNVSVTFYDIDQDALMTALDLAGIAGSTGSACVSGSSEPSHVIQALGQISDRQAATLRLTLGRNTNLADIKQTVNSLKDIIKRLKQ